MSRTKILYFDYWTVGLKNFSYFDEALKANGCETKLLHLNSWRKIDGPKNQVLNKIAAYDITYYKTIWLYKVLKLEQPAVVVMLNSSFITDRAIILACKKLGIKSVYLMHGDVMREEFRDKTVQSVNKRMSIVHKSKMVVRQIRNIFNYLYSLVHYDWTYLFKLHPYRILIGTFHNPGSYMFFPPATFDIKPDVALVYGELDRQFFAKKFADHSFVRVVGNPELDDFFKRFTNLKDFKDEFFLSNGISVSRPFVTYIEEGIVENKFWTNQERLDFIREITEIVDQQGYQLVIKLHPRTAKGPYRSSLNNLAGAIVVDQIDFPKLMFFSEIIISHYSTTLIFPMLLDKPIIVPRWGRSANLIKLNSSKEVTFVENLDEFKTLMKKRSFQYDRAEFLNNVAPFRDGDTSKRIAKNILELTQ